VVIFGQSTSAQLNGKLGEAIWWDEQRRCWEVRVFATGKVASLPETCIMLAEPCAAGGELPRCPCWPAGRGVYPVSLGNRCCTKLGIDECTGPIEAPGGYPHFHGQEYMPFDSILTSLDGILFFLRHNFAHFFHWNTCLDVSPKQCPHVVFNTYRSTLHAFPHHHPVKDSDKLWRRVERFRALCRHARNARGARTPVFIRFVGSSEEFARIEELYSILRLWAGASARLFVVSMLQTAPKEPPRVLRHASLPRVVFYLTGVVTVMDFMPIREACRLAVFDEAGLLQCGEVTTEELLAQVRPFTDPYTTKGRECDETWLTPLGGKDPAFFSDCPSAQKPGQGSLQNDVLRKAVRRGDVKAVAGALPERSAQGADPNTWDDGGRTPLHDLCDLAGRGIRVKVAVQCAASLLLAHGDPRCPDRGRETPLEVALRKPRGPTDPGCPEELKALMQAAAMDASREVDASALYRALELLDDPRRRSTLARLLALGGLRALGEAEFAWRNPEPGGEEVIGKVAEELKALEQLSEVERKKAMKRLLLEWHPDKNAHRLSLATTVFQYLQSHKGGVFAR